jgi:hypothetical protein
MTTKDLYDIFKNNSAVFKQYPLIRSYITQYETITKLDNKFFNADALVKIISYISENPPSELLDILRHKEGGLKDGKINLDISVPDAAEIAAMEINKISPPPVSEQLKSLATAALEYAKSGFKDCPDKEYQERLAICGGCEFFDKAAFNGAGRCLKCGCSGLKLKLAISSCPIGKWQSLI